MILAPAAAMKVTFENLSCTMLLGSNEGLLILYQFDHLWRRLVTSSCSGLFPVAGGGAGTKLPAASVLNRLPTSLPAVAVGVATVVVSELLTSIGTETESDR